MPDVENENQNQTQLLADLESGQWARVSEVRVDGSLGERMLEMGLTPGTPVCIVRRGLLGDPIQLAVRGSMLSLRRAQACRVAVELIP